MAQHLGLGKALAPHPGELPTQETAPGPRLVAEASPNPLQSALAKVAEMWGVVKNVPGIVTPDAVGYDNSLSTDPKSQFPGLKSAGSSQFYRFNPLRDGMVTVYTSYPKRKVVVGGIPFSAVDAATLILGKGVVSREAGFGYSKKMGQGTKTLSIFINGRGGDLSKLSTGQRVSVQFGVTGSPELLIDALDRLPNAGRFKPLRDTLQKGLELAATGGSRYGLIWRASLGLNARGQVELDLFGQKIELATLQQALKTVDLRNQGHKPVARLNNEDAYLQGANPWQRTEDNRRPTGQYLNHGDPIAGLAARMLVLQKELDPQARPIRDAAQARSFMEYLMARQSWATPEQARQVQRSMPQDVGDLKVDPHPLSPQQRARVDQLLQDVYRLELNFGSEKIKQAAEAAGLRHGWARAPLPERRFAQEVFSGKYAVQSQEGANLLKTVAGMLNAPASVVLDGLNAGSVARDGDMVHNGRVMREQGLRARMEANLGGVLAPLGLGLPQGQAMQPYKEQVVRELTHQLAKSLGAKGIQVNGQSLFDELMRLSPQERQRLGQGVAKAVQ